MVDRCRPTIMREYTSMTNAKQAIPAQIGVKCLDTRAEALVFDPAGTRGRAGWVGRWQGRSAPSDSSVRPLLGDVQISLVAARSVIAREVRERSG